MDFKRIILYVILAVIGYLIILQWNEDYYSKNAEQKAQESKLTEAIINNDVINNISDIKNKKDEEDLNSNLKFSQPDLANTEKQNLSNLDSINTLNNFIQVKTNKFQLKINLDGGDIVNAELLDYKESLNSKNNFKLLNNAQTYYVVQSEIQGLKTGRTKYTAEKNNYDFSGDSDINKLILSSQNVDYKINKIFEFSNNLYEIKVSYEIENLTDKNITPSFLGLIKRDNSKDPSSKNSTSYSFLGAAYSTDEFKYEKISFEDFGKNKFNTSTQKGWIAILQQYFISAWILNDKYNNQITTAKDSNGNNVIGFLTSPINIKPLEKGTLESKIYIGPKVQKYLAAVADNLKLSVDFGWLWFISQPLFWILDFVYKFVGNWGIAIIILTFLIKLAFFNLSAKSYKSMANMKKITPKLQKIKEQYPDKKMQSQAMMELYSKEKINPMGGCLPILIQMPVFIALYWMLMESIELRQAPFYFWIQDLSVKDPYFILPLLMGLTMFIQQFLNPPATDPMQDKIMKLMPIIFTVFFLWFPSGLVLYWLTNNILSILQQWIITRSIEKGEKKA